MSSNEVPIRMSATDTLSMVSVDLERELQMVVSKLDTMIDKTCKRKTATLDQLKEKEHELQRIFDEEQNNLNQILTVLETVDPRTMELEVKTLENLKKRRTSVNRLQTILQNVNDRISTLQNVYVEAISELEDEQKVVRQTLELNLSKVKELIGMPDDVPVEEMFQVMQRQNLGVIPEEEEQREGTAAGLMSISSETAADLVEEMANEAKELKEKVSRKMSYMDSELNEATAKAMTGFQMDLKNFRRESTERQLEEKGFHINERGCIIAEDGKEYTIMEAIQKGMLHGMEMEAAECAFMDYLQSRGLNMTPSGHLMCTDGQVISMEEARMRGLFNGLEPELENIIFLNILALTGVQMRASQVADNFAVLAKGRTMSLSQANEAKIFEGLMYDTAHYILSVFLAGRGLTMTNANDLISLRNNQGGNMTLEEARELGLLEGLDPEIFRMIFNVVISQRQMRVRSDGLLETSGGRVLTAEEAKMLGLLDGIVLPEEDQRKLNCLLEQYGFRVDDKGMLETATGTVTLKEARLVGMLTEINNDILLKQVEADASASTTTVTRRSRTSSYSEETFLSSIEESENNAYLKKVFGAILPKCLAEVVARQPQDPIHYIAHWLYNYRIQQEKDVKRKAELMALLEERARLQHLDTVEDTRKMILKMIYRAEIDAELARIARMEAEAEEGDENFLDYKSQFLADLFG